MIILLLLVKILDLDFVEMVIYSVLRLMIDIEFLVVVLKKKLVCQLKNLMKVSDNIVVLNVECYQSFVILFILDNVKFVVLVFKGDVYLGLEVEIFLVEDMDFV